MLGEKKRILITVKAYPNPSIKYGETVCVAGIDIIKNKWIRLYPIPFRELDKDKKFKKYSIIEANVEKAQDDKRLESFRIYFNSIKIIDHFDTKNNWQERKKYVLSEIDNSFCELLKKSETDDISLGIFKPNKIKFYWKKTKDSLEEKRKASYAQKSLFHKNKNMIEFIPFDFRYNFFCENELNCPGHDLLIIDWEIKQAYRKWRWKYKSEKILLEMIRERWLNRICSIKNDVYFIVGNMQRIRKNFMILSIFYPPKT